MNNTTEFICICQTPDIITIFSILGVLVPLIISEILPLSNCEANGLIDGIIKLCKIKNGATVAPRRGG